MNSLSKKFPERQILAISSSVVVIVCQHSIRLKVVQGSVDFHIPGHHVAVRGQIVPVVPQNEPACFHIAVGVEVIPLAVNLLPAVFVILVLPFAVVPAARVLIPANGSRLGLRLSLCLRFRLCCRLLLRLL